MSTAIENTEKWADLAARLGSAAALVVVGLGGIWLGGDVFHVMIALICGVMVWELVAMLDQRSAKRPLALGAFAGVAMLLAFYLPAGLGLPLLLAPALVGFGQLEKHRTIFMTFSVLILLAGFGMAAVRDNSGFASMAWLVTVVIVTDVFGYFAGRMIGGPKFWPKVSPKKTWSGTSAGWIGAAVVGLVFALITDAGLNLIGVSVAVSMASQMGDFAESAVKRRCGVKDSSRLLPGHGGLLDRFDGMLGASVFLLLIGQFVVLPGLV